jgi:hypothetical protein
MEEDLAEPEPKAADPGAFDRTISGDNDET